MNELKRQIIKFDKYRELLKQLISRDLKVKYRRSVLGYLWSLLNPLLMMIVVSAVFSYMYKENSPLSVRVLDLNRDIQISTEGITIHLDVKITIDEFPENELYNKKKRQEVQQYVQEKFNEEFTRVIKHLQKAKSDVLGLGGMVRAYENSLYKQPWRDTYSTLPIKVTSKVTIRRTGIMF